MKVNRLNPSSASTRGLIALTIALMIAASNLPAMVHAAAGDLDLTFGSGGKVTTEFAVSSQARGESIAIQSDGKIVVAGVAGASGEEVFALARYNTDGSLDGTFGSGGKVSTNFLPGSLDFASTVAIQANGKIVAAGATSDSTVSMRVFALARYNSDGSLDTTFGTGGKVTTNFTGRDEAAAIVVQSDGKIVSAGKTGNSTTLGDFALARYNPDGSLDTSFGSGGKVVTDIDGFDNAEGLALQGDGKLVAVGTASMAFAVARYNSDGSLDSTFGSSGKVTTEITPFRSAAVDVVIQLNGNIIAGGVALSALGDFDFALARYNTDGSLDPSFGSGGKVVTDLFTGGDFIFGVALQSDGKIVAGGSSFGASVDFALARYNSNGSLDSSFGSGGMITTDFDGLNDTANDIALQTDGRIVATGVEESRDGSTNFALARYLGDTVPCAINCPANITVSNAQNQCGATVAYSNPTTSGDCRAVACNPPSNSFFSVGTTSVTCNAGGGSGCSFTVSVVDTQAPTITCPANVTIAAPAACPPSAGVNATYITPAGNDNCPGVMTVCSPPSGSAFPAGTTSVTCAAMDAAGSMASCSFAVTVFDVILQDDSRPQTALLFNSRTGDYRFCCGGTTFTGRGTVTTMGCVLTLAHNTTDRRVFGRADQSVFRGTGSLQSPPGNTRCTIGDRNTRDDTSYCAH